MKGNVYLQLSAGSIVIWRNGKEVDKKCKMYLNFLSLLYKSELVSMAIYLYILPQKKRCTHTAHKINEAEKKNNFP